MKNRFVKQVAVVSGGARGMGETIGVRLAREGATVCLLDNNKELLEQTVEKYQKEGLDIWGLFCDISNESELIAAYEQILTRNNRVDILINSAGIVGPNGTKITDYTTEQFKKVIAVNLTGSFIVTKHVIPIMLRQNYGRILLISSIGGKEGNPGMAGYVASKSGVMGLVKGIGKEYAGTGITVNGLAPAVIATPMNLQTDPSMMEYMKSKIPMGRLGTVEEVASIACWIVSKEASFNTGVVFDLSGGRATF